MKLLFVDFFLRFCLFFLEKANLQREGKTEKDPLSADSFPNGCSAWDWTDLKASSGASSVSPMWGCTVPRMQAIFHHLCKPQEGSWMRSGAAVTWTGAHTGWQRCKQRISHLSHYAGPFPFVSKVTMKLLKMIIAGLALLCRVHSVDACDNQEFCHSPGCIALSPATC